MVMGVAFCCGVSNTACSGLKGRRPVKRDCGFQVLNGMGVKEGRRVRGLDQRRRVELLEGNPCATDDAEITKSARRHWEDPEASIARQAKGKCQWRFVHICGAHIETVWAAVESRISRLFWIERES